jgi:hypothetical protein
MERALTGASMVQAYGAFHLTLMVAAMLFKAVFRGR